MIKTVHTCASCSSENLVRNGKNAAGSQRYKCKDCGVTRVLECKQAYSKVDMDAVHRTFEERNSYRSTARIFGVSHVTVFNWLKKKPAACRTSNKA
jgi:transposase-like protein